jgi:uncharacterized membrane protein
LSLASGSLAARITLTALLTSVLISVSDAVGGLLFLFSTGAFSTLIFTTAVLLFAPWESVASNVKTSVPLKPELGV